MMNVPQAPVFYPTEEEWSKDSLQYIQAVRAKCQGYGIAKIVPPKSWKPNFSITTDKSLVATRLQRIDRLGAHARAKSAEMQPDRKEMEGNPIERVERALAEARARVQMGEADEVEQGQKEIAALENHLQFLNKLEQKSKRARWKKCCTCKGMLDEVKMTNCTECKRWFHIFCLSPPLHEVPEDAWTCAECLEYKKQSFGFGNGKKYSLDEYKHRGDRFKREWFKLKQGQRPASVPFKDIEKQFWKIVQKGKPHVEVEYGSELDVGELGSGFPLKGPFAAHPWNLNNLARAGGSVLRHLDDIAGITIPWLYIGMCFSSFCWHNEDHYCYSISYNHRGAPKQWYGIPGDCAAAFEAMMRETYPKLFAKQPDLLYQLVTLVAPSTLKKHGVSVCRAIHNPGEFIVTFPQAYHAGFNYGFNVAEAVNFACPDWVSWGTRAVEHYRTFRRVPVFSHDELIVRIAMCEEGLETAAWVENGLQRIRDVEYQSRFDLFKRGLCDHARWPKEKRVQDSGAKKPRKRKYRNVVHKNDWKSSKGAGRAKGEIPSILDHELGGYSSASDKKNACLAKLRKVFGKPNGNSQDHCAICKYPLYLSAVFCPCTPNLSCLSHAKDLCTCPLSQKHIRYRFSLWEMDVLNEKVKEKLSGNTEEKICSIITESKSIFKHTIADQKAITGAEAPLLKRAEKWENCVDALTSGPQESITPSKIRKLLEEGRQLIWASSRVHSCRDRYEKLLDLETTLQEIHKYVKAPPKIVTCKSIDKDKRPNLTVGEALAQKAKAFPDGLKVGQEVKQFNEIIRIGREMREKLELALEGRLLDEGKCDTKLRRKRKCSWETISDLISSARQYVFVIPEMHLLQDKMDRVKDWLAEHAELTMDAEMHTCFTSRRIKDMVSEKLPPNVNRKQRIKRKRELNSLDDFDEKEKERPGRKTLARCKQMLKIASKLPVTLFVQEEDLRSLVNSAEIFAKRVKQSISEAENWAKGRKRSSHSYARLCSAHGCHLIRTLVGGAAFGSDSSSTPTHVPVQTLLDLHSQADDVALYTDEAASVRDRLLRNKHFRNEASSIISSLAPTEFYASSWGPAELLLKEAHTGKLDCDDFTDSLEHVLAWRVWANTVDSACRGQRDYEVLQMLLDCFGQLCYLEKHLKWSRKMQKRGRSTVSESKSHTSRHDVLQETLSTGKELQALCKRAIGELPENEGKENTGSSPMEAEAADQHKVKVKMTVGDLEGVLQAVSAKKFKNVGEGKVMQLLESAKEWRRDLSDAIPQLNANSSRNMEVESKSMKPWTISALRALKDKGNSLQVSLPMIYKIEEHISAIRSLGVDIGLLLDSVVPEFARHLESWQRNINEGSERTLEYIKSAMLPRLKRITKDIDNLNADFTAARRVRRLAWATDIVASRCQMVDFSTYQDLNTRKKICYVNPGSLASGLDEDVKESPVEIFIVQVASRSLSGIVEPGEHLLSTLHRELENITLISRLRELQEMSRRIPAHFPEILRTEKTIRRCRVWLLQMKSAFPEILKDELLGISPLEMGAPQNTNQSLEFAQKLAKEANDLKLGVPCVRHLKDVVQQGNQFLKLIDKEFHPRPRWLNLRTTLHQILLHAPVEETIRNYVIQNFGDNKKDEKGKELYCICRRSNSKLRMVCCDFCQEWFHASCVLITQAQLAALEKDENAKYRCPRCSHEAKEPYQYGNLTLFPRRPKHEDLEKILQLYTSSTLHIVEGQMLDLILRIVSFYRKSACQLLKELEELLPKKSDESLETLKEINPCKVKAVRKTMRHIEKLNLVIPENFEAQEIILRFDIRKTLSDSCTLEDLEDLLARHRQLKRAKEMDEEKSMKLSQEQESTIQKHPTVKTEGDVKESKASMKASDEKTEDSCQIKEDKETPVSVKPELKDRATDKAMACEDSGQIEDEKNRYHRKRRCKSESQGSSKKTKLQHLSQAKPKYPQANEEDPFEISLLYNVINKCRRLKSQAKEGLRKRWKPESDAAKRFLDACKGLERVEIEEVEDLKAKTKVYCLCKKLAEDVFMIGCDKCDEWYHPKCIGMSEESARKLDSFICGRC